ncbi:MAG: hypothetical protein ACJ8CB_31620 [Ktedonobacteraceae bacterium]
MISKHTAEHFLWRDICDGFLVNQPTRLTMVQERMPSGISQLRH